MSTRAQIRASILAMLGTSSDDPQYSTTILDPIIQEGVYSLLTDMQDVNPDYFAQTPVTLIADSSTSHNYSFSIQAPAITGFAKWLEVRYDDEDGAELDECRLEELREFGSDFFAIIGPDDTPTLVTSKDSPAGNRLWFRYAYWPAAMSVDNDVPSSIPSRFHDVIALECLFAFGLGGEQSLPPDLHTRWINRRSQLMSRVSRRGIKPGRTKLMRVEED